MNNSHMIKNTGSFAIWVVVSLVVAFWIAFICPTMYQSAGAETVAGGASVQGE